jgi:hypothetical protein
VKNPAHLKERLNSTGQPLLIEFWPLLFQKVRKPFPLGMNQGRDSDRSHISLDPLGNAREDSVMSDVAMRLMDLGSQAAPIELGLFRTPPVPAIEANREKDRIAGRLSGFNAKDTPVWREITQRFGNNIKQPELLSIAQVLASSAEVKLDRDAKRRKTVLVKWFEENWERIAPFMDYVVLEDAHVN